MRIGKPPAAIEVDFALEAQRQHENPPSEAIYQACLVRFRPIMMTTMAALMGALPIALGFGAGAESRRPLGISVVGGLLMLSLLLYPLAILSGLAVVVLLGAVNCMFVLLVLRQDY